MEILFYDTKSYDEHFFNKANKAFGHHFRFLHTRLNENTAALSQGFRVICVFVNDTVNAAVLDTLAQHGVRLVALRCAGFNNVDLVHAKRVGIRIVRVPAYSPEAVAEHAVGLMLALNRKYHKAHLRVREGNFSLEGLLGFNMHGKTAGIIGTGRIGTALARILTGFGMHLLAFDPSINPQCKDLGVCYVDLPRLYQEADIISLHCPLNAETFHLIDEQALQQMKQDVMLINTSRGAVLDTKAVILKLKQHKIGALGLDVYEQEEDLFFEDHYGEIIQDDLFERLLTFPNVLITGHQGFFTTEALTNIACTTLSNIREFEGNAELTNEVRTNTMTN